MHKRRLRSEPRSSLLRVLLLDGHNVRTRYAPYTGPQSLDCASYGKPRGIRKWRHHFDPCRGITLTEFHGIAEASARPQTVEGHHGQRPVASIEVQPQGLARFVPIFVNSALSSELQFGIP